MLRFFESEVDSWWSMAATPPPPPCHYVELPVDPRLQVRDHYSESGTTPAMNIAQACRRVPSALATVDLVKGRWSPATVVSNGSSLSSPNSSSSLDSMNSYGGCGIISWQNSNAFSIESAIDPYIAPLKVDRSSSIAMDSGRRNQHEVMVDLRQHRRKLDENKNIEAVLRDSKRQKTGVREGDLQQYCFTSFESTSSSPSMMMTAQQNLKAPMKRSQKLGDKITALQQLVSPFGKADTASVLHEAAVYIKALHEQVKLLSKPYVESISLPEGIQGMKNGADQNCHYKSSSLRREGLCMVPISPSIISLANQELLDI